MPVLASLLHDLLAVASGGLVGFSLGLIGGGGSILAVPLLIYGVGLTNAHMAIGTSALAVSVNAFANLIPHARAGHVRWRPAWIYAGTGVLGALAGSTLGKAVDGKRLLFLFALLMIVVAIAMLRPRAPRAEGDAPLTSGRIAKLVLTGFATGALAGFFGIGGGFLIVPGLLFAGGLTMLQAIGSSLVSVGSFGLATAANYARSGLIDWQLAAEFIGGGVLGGWVGMHLAVRLGSSRRTLNYVFAGVVFVVALYMLYRTAG